MKDKDKNLLEQPNNQEIRNLYEKKFRVMKVKMTQDLRNRTEVWALQPWGGATGWWAG